MIFNFPGNIFNSNLAKNKDKAKENIVPKSSIDPCQTSVYWRKKICVIEFLPVEKILRKRRCRKILLLWCFGDITKKIWCLNGGYVAQVKALLITISFGVDFASYTRAEKINNSLHNSSRNIFPKKILLGEKSGLACNHVISSVYSLAVCTSAQ